MRDGLAGTVEGWRSLRNRSSGSNQRGAQRTDTPQRHLKRCLGLGSFGAGKKWGDRATVPYLRIQSGGFPTCIAESVSIGELIAKRTAARSTGLTITWALPAF
jgi:hypothetical protein